MGNFLDKVGLQHFVEKIKGLLSGYLPLSGGTMTGAIGYFDNETNTGITLNKEKLNCASSITDSTRSGSFSAEGTTVHYKGTNDTYGKVNISTSSMNFDGLYLMMASTKKGVSNAAFTTYYCKNKEFKLSKDLNDGLIANNSETVVKELSDEQVDKLLAGDTSVIDGSKYYVSGANLARFAQNVAKDKSYTIIYAEYGNVEVKTSNGNVTVEPGTSTRIDEICPVVSGKENVTSLVYKGYAPNEGQSFFNMTNLKTVDVFDLNTSNVTDMSAYFAKCYSLNVLGTSLSLVRDIKFWDTRKVVSFEKMFIACESLTTLDLRYWNTQKVTSMGSMFAGCTKLSNLNLEGWDTRSVYVMENLFTNCSNMSSLQLGEGFGRMQDSVGTVDFSMMSRWTNNSVDSLTKLYDRKANGMGVITIKLSAATKSALGPDEIRELTFKGYTIA